MPNGKQPRLQLYVMCDPLFFFLAGISFFMLGSVVRSYMRKWGTFDKWRRMGLDGVYV